MGAVISILICVDCSHFDVDLRLRASQCLVLRRQFARIEHLLQTKALVFVELFDLGKDALWVILVDEGACLASQLLHALMLLDRPVDSRTVLVDKRAEDKLIVKRVIVRLLFCILLGYEPPHSALMLRCGG